MKQPPEDLDDPPFQAADLEAGFSSPLPRVPRAPSTPVDDHVEAPTPVRGPKRHP